MWTGLHGELGGSGSAPLRIALIAAVGVVARRVGSGALRGAERSGTMHRRLGVLKRRFARGGIDRARFGEKGRQGHRGVSRTHPQSSES